MTTSGTLEAEVRQLRKEVQELRDVREINEVFRRWNYACTGGFNGIQAGRMEALDCLTDDATIEVQGLHEPGTGPQGREQCVAYWEYYYGDNGPLPYVFQTSFDETVVIDGDTAIQYCNFMMFGQRRDNPPTFGLSRRVNYLVRTPKGWKIRKTTGDHAFRIQLEALLGNTKNELKPLESRTPKHMRPLQPHAGPMAPWPYRRTDTGK